MSGLLSNREPRSKGLDVASDLKTVKSYKTMAFKVDEELQMAMKLHCVKTGKQMGTVLNELIEQYLKDQAELF